MNSLLSVSPAIYLALEGGLERVYFQYHPPGGSLTVMDLGALIEHNHFQGPLVLATQI